MSSKYRVMPVLILNRILGITVWQLFLDHPHRITNAQSFFSTVNLGGVYHDDVRNSNIFLRIVRYAG
jgi:hypothetical protein